MLQAKILTGNLTGSVRPIRSFPFLIGRSAAANLRLEEPGVWERHVSIELDPASGFLLTIHENARVRLNGAPIRGGPLKNGDVIEIGAVKLEVWLSPVEQHSLGPRELGTWAALGCMAFGEIGLVYWLLRQ